jgi:MFS superfamily sulfate permease-like transporter
VVARADGPLFYANTSVVETRLLELVASADPKAEALVLDVSATTDLDVQSADMLAEVAERLAKDGVELRLVDVRAPALDRLRRRGLVPGLRVDASIDDALEPNRPVSPQTPPEGGRG